MWKTRALTEKTEVHEALQRDRCWAAYPIGDLEDDLFPKCEWHLAEDGKGGFALGLVFTGFDLPIVFTMGRLHGLAALFAGPIAPSKAFFETKAGHLAVIRRWYDLGAVDRMLRMTVPIEYFRPAAGKPRRLSGADVPGVRRVFERGGGGSFFADWQLDRGVFYGMDDGAQLVSVAGTHLASEKYKIAAIGNVATVPEHRRKGYASLCSSAVTEELLAGGMDVVLNVNEKETTAVGIYKKLGFRPYCRFVEVVGTRR